MDPAPTTGEILLIAFDNESLRSLVLRLTPATAAKLAQRLINDERGDLDSTVAPSHGAQQIHNQVSSDLVLRRAELRSSTVEG